MARLLEWGQATDDPGSRVLDVEGRMMFTGSTVTPLTVDEFEQRGHGRVTELDEDGDGTHVRVAWTRGPESVCLSRKVRRIG